jgi:hypothetical protein
MNLLTTTLNDKKTIVLAKKEKYNTKAILFTNWNQAYKKQCELTNLGIECKIYQPEFGVNYIQFN